MKMNLPVILSAACLTAMLSSNLSADSHKSDEHDHDKEKHEHEMEQHGAHEHGAARMTVAVTETGLEITLESPAANIFGFEHNAGTDEEHHIVHKAADKLKTGDELFNFDEKAGCKLDDADVESSVIAAHDKEKHGDGEHNDHDKHDEHKEDGHDHDKHDEDKEEKEEKHEDHDEHKNHDHGKKEEHDHDEHKEHENDKHDHDKHDDHEKDEHDHESEGTHSDVDVTWTFKCAQPDQLTQMDTTIFSAFPKGFERLNVEWINKEAAGAVELEADGTVKFSQ